MLSPCNCLWVRGAKLVRTAATLTGRSGRLYVRDRILQTHPRMPEFNVELARTIKSSCDDQAYVLKPLSEPVIELSNELKREFGKNPRIRTHVDEIEESGVLVYEYLKDNLLSFIKHNADLPIKARKYILWEIGLANKDLHSKNWIHLDLKPNNVMLDWSRDARGEFHIGRVVLSDLDWALELEGDKLLNHRMGNVMWRSPEGQIGKGLGKHSEVFSFGLMFLFTITGVETMHPDFEELAKNGIEPEQVLLYKLLATFGTAPPELIKHIDDEEGSQLLTEISEFVSAGVPDRPFVEWTESELPNLNSEAKRMISRMTILDPAKRATMEQIMDDPWWR